MAARASRLSFFFFFFLIKDSYSGRRQTWRSWAPSESRSLTRNASWTNGWGRSELRTVGTFSLAGFFFFTQWRFLKKKNVLPLLVFLSGKVGVSCEVEGMVIQVSASGAAQPETMKTTTARRLLLLAELLAKTFLSPFYYYLLNYNYDMFFLFPVVVCLNTAQPIQPFFLFFHLLSFVHNTVCFVSVKLKETLLVLFWFGFCFLSSDYRDVWLVFIPDFKQKPNSQIWEGCSISDW